MIDPKYPIDLYDPTMYILTNNLGHTLIPSNDAAKIALHIFRLCYTNCKFFGFQNFSLSIYFGYYPFPYLIN